MAVALKLADDVHEVLEHARARDPTVLRHVADKQGGQVGLLGDTDEGCRDRAHLRDPARPALDLGGGNGLHGVDDQQGGGDLLDVPEDDAELRLIRDQEVRLERADALRAPAHLGRRLLARHVEDGAAPARRRRARGLRGHVQQQCRLTDAGLTGQEDHRARNDAASQDPVQLTHARRARRGPLPIDLTDRQRGTPRGGGGGTRASRDLAGLVDRAPRPALAALAHPLGGGPAAVGAAVRDLLFRHALTVTRPTLICGSRARRRPQVCGPRGRNEVRRARRARARRARGGKGPGSGLVERE